MTETGPPPPINADARHRRAPRWAAGAAALLGAIGTAQARLNGELGARSGDGMLTALISNSSALLILGTILVLSPVGRHGFRRLYRSLRLRSLPWWYLLGGLPGAVYALSQSIATVPLGIALFMVTMVAGQVVGGLVIDQVGITPGGRRPLTAGRVVGALLALLAAGVSVTAQIDMDAPLWLLWMPALAGAGQSWQQAVNGRVKETARSALTATAVSYFFGTVALVAIVLLDRTVTARAADFPAEPWLYAGGALGCLFIAGSAIIVRFTGVLLLGLSIVAGQLLCAVALELLIPAGDAGAASSAIAGAALALVAVVVARVGGDKRPLARPAASIRDPNIR